MRTAIAAAAIATTAVACHAIGSACPPEEQPGAEAAAFHEVLRATLHALDTEAHVLRASGVGEDHRELRAVLNRRHALQAQLAGLESQPHADQPDLRAHLEELHAAIADAERKGDVARAEELRAVARALAAESEAQADRRQEVERHVAALHEELAAVERAMQELRVRPVDDERRKRAQLADLERRADELRAGIAGAQREVDVDVIVERRAMDDQRRAEQMEIEERLARLHEELAQTEHAIAEARETGYERRQAELERHADELRAAIREHEHATERLHAEGRPEGPALEDRLRHAHEAMEHLHAAGLHEHAERLVPAIERLEWAVAERHAQREAEERARGERRRAELLRRRAEQAVSADTIRALKDEIAALREELADMRRRLDEQRRDRDR
jgi:chromosome segregation ATPase